MAFDSMLDVKTYYNIYSKRKINILCRVVGNLRSLKKNAFSLSPFELGLEGFVVIFVLCKLTEFAQIT